MPRKNAPCTLLPYQDPSPSVIEVCLDECARGCLFGSVFVGAVILPKDFVERANEANIVIRDSKKMSAKQREASRRFIEANALAYAVVSKDSETIDKYNILQTVMMGMHDAIRHVSTVLRPTKILVDGDKFLPYEDESSGEVMEHETIVEGDATYAGIASAAILAKTHHDEYIQKLVEEEPHLREYDIQNNQGYGTKLHLEGIQRLGITEYHRKSFRPCQAGYTFDAEARKKERERVSKRGPLKPSTCTFTFSDEIEEEEEEL